MQMKADAPIAQQGQFSNGYVLYAVFSLAIVNAFNGMDRVAIAILAPAIQGDMQLSDAQMGLLLGLAFSLFYGLCGIPIARLADRGNRRAIVTAALAIWSLMTALMAAAQSFLHLFLARMGVAAGEAGGLSPSSSMICDYASGERRAGFFSIQIAGGLIGTAGGAMLVGWLGQEIGWRHTFMVLGVAGIVFAMLVGITLREPSRGYFEHASSAKAASFAQVLAYLWRCPTYKWVVVATLTIGLGATTFLQWWPSYFVRVLGLSSASAGLYFGLANGVGTLTGLFLGGALSNKVAARDPKLPLVFAACSMLLAIIVMAAALLAPLPMMTAACIAISACLIGVALPAITSTLYSVVSANMRATAGTIAGLLNTAVGVGIGAFAVGMLSDRLRPTFGEESLRYAMLALVPTMLVAVWALFSAARSFSDDVRALKSRHEDDAGAAAS